MSEQFRVGDRVCWTSQAQGSARTKVGTIAEVVLAGFKPNRERFLRLYRGSGCGCARREVSYVVTVGPGEKPYWPLASKLRKLEDGGNLTGMPITREEFAAIVRMLRVYELDDKFFNPLVAMQTRATAVKALHKLEYARRAGEVK